jgi:hypothetical protein
MILSHRHRHNQARGMTLTLLAVLLLSVLATPAAATLLTWNLSGVTLEDGGTVTGSFVYDTANYSPLDSWNIAAASAGGTYAFTFDPSNSGSAHLATVDGQVVNVNTPQPPAGTVNGEVAKTYGLEIYFNYSASLATPGVIPLAVQKGFFQVNSYEWIEIIHDWSQTSVDYKGLIVAGELTTVPLPPSALLLGSGLMALAGWRRLRQG